MDRNENYGERSIRRERERDYKQDEMRIGKGERRWDGTGEETGK